jgi:hypothetical protein
MDNRIETLSKLLQESNRMRLEAAEVSITLRDLAKEYGGDIADDLERIASEIDLACYNLAEVVGGFFKAKMSLVCTRVDIEALENVGA